MKPLHGFESDHANDLARLVSTDLAGLILRTHPGDIGMIARGDPMAVGALATGSHGGAARGSFRRRGAVQRLGQRLRPHLERIHVIANKEIPMGQAIPRQASPQEFPSFGRGKIRIHGCRQRSERSGYFLAISLAQLSLSPRVRLKISGTEVGATPVGEYGTSRVKYPTRSN